MKPDMNIVESPFKDVHVPDIDLWNFIEQHCKSHGNQAAIIASNSSEKTTYKDLLCMSHNVAANLLSEGYRVKESPLLVFMRSSVEFIVTCLAVWRLGGYLVCVNPLLTATEFESVFDLITCDIIVCDDDNSTVVHEALDKRGLHKKVFAKSVPSPSLLFRDLCEHRHSLPYLTRPSVTDTAVILLSSGTTGRPKGVEISHRAIVGQILMFSSPELGNLPRGTAILYQPFSHVYGLTLMLIHLTMGVTFVLMESFSLHKFTEHVIQYKPDQLHLVPPIAVLLCKNTTLRRQDLSFVRSIASGAAPLGPELYSTLRQVFSDSLTVRQLYGLTEAAGGCIGVPFSHKSSQCPPGSIGWPFPNVRAKVIGLSGSDLAALGPHHTGELCLKSQFFMKSYRHGTADTSARTIRAFDEDGWLHTGDLAYYNTKGCFFIVDRLKELIKCKGYQVAPAELESVLLSHPEVCDAGVTGVPHTHWGEAPLAWVVRKSGSGICESQLAEFVKKRVAPFKRLEGGIVFVKEIPKSSSGKTLRREIKQITLQKKLTSKL